MDNSPSPIALPPTAQSLTTAGRRRLVLALAVLLTLVAALALSRWLAPLPSVEPDLLRLLRAMVLIKGLIALGAAGLVWWRLGRPIGSGLAMRYTAALCLCAGALGWLWGLHLVLLGSLGFYAGLAGVALSARRDPLLSAFPSKQPRRLT